MTYSRTVAIACFVVIMLVTALTPIGLPRATSVDAGHDDPTTSHLTEGFGAVDGRIVRNVILGNPIPVCTDVVPSSALVAVPNGGDSTEHDAELIAGAQALGAGRPSLLQDVIRGRRVEIDALNGWVADRGQDVEIPTPCNNAIAEVVRSFPVGALRPDPANLQSVLARLDFD